MTAILQLTKGSEVVYKTSSPWKAGARLEIGFQSGNLPNKITNGHLLHDIDSIAYELIILHSASIPNRPSCVKL